VSDSESPNYKAGRKEKKQNKKKNKVLCNYDFFSFLYFWLVVVGLILF